MGDIPTQNNFEHFLRATSTSFKTTVNRDMQSERHKADDHEVAANSIGSWVRSTEKIENMPKDSDSSRQSMRLKIIRRKQIP